MFFYPLFCKEGVNDIINMGFSDGLLVASEKKNAERMSGPEAKEGSHGTLSSGHTPHYTHQLWFPE